MDAAERLAHLGAEPVSDVVSCNPATGSVTERGGHVGRVRFGANDDDPIAWVAGGAIVAAAGEGSSVDDDQIWFQLVHRRVEFSVEEEGLPATVLVFE